MVSPGMHNMQMLNFNNIFNVKDSRWLQLEVCREFQRNKCSRPDTECKFAHPPVNVEVQNGRVTACYDSIKGRCNREKPPCKYFHPPQHLKDQLLINGRNHLALKNAFMTQIQIQGLSPNTQLPHGTLPVQPSSPYIPGIPTVPNFNPYIASSPVMAVGVTEAVPSPLTGVVPQAVVSTQKVAPRTDRLEAFPAMNAYKRPAPDKSGMPVYQSTGNAAYQQALMQQLGGQSYVPVTCEYGSGHSNLLALPPPPAAEVPTPAIHSAASSSVQPETPSTSAHYSSPTASTSSISSISNSAPSYSSSTLSTSTLSSTSSTSAGKASALHALGSSASPSSLPATPTAVLSYSGYAFNKGIRPPPKSQAALPQFIASPNAAVTVPSGIPSFSLGSGGPFAAAAAGAAVPFTIPNVNFGVGGMPINVPSLGGLGMMSAHPQQGVASNIGGFVQAGIPAMHNVGGIAGVPNMISPPQFVTTPASSIYLPQLTALTNNPPLAWAQAGEQPYKKLKTS